MTDSNVDAALALSGFLAGAVMQAAAGADLKFNAFSDGIMEAALAKNDAKNAVSVLADVCGTAADGWSWPSATC